MDKNEDIYARTRGRGRGQDSHHMRPEQSIEPRPSLEDAYGHRSRPPQLQPMIIAEPAEDLIRREEAYRLGMEEQVEKRDYLRKKKEEKRKQQEAELLRKREDRRLADEARRSGDGGRLTSNRTSASSSTIYSKGNSSSSRTFYGASRDHPNNSTRSSTRTVSRDDYKLTSASHSSSHRDSHQRPRENRDRVQTSNSTSRSSSSSAHFPSHSHTERQRDHKDRDRNSYSRNASAYQSSARRHPQPVGSPRGSKNYSGHSRSLQNAANSKSKGKDTDTRSRSRTKVIESITTISESKDEKIIVLQSIPWTPKHDWGQTSPSLLPPATPPQPVAAKIPTKQRGPLYSPPNHYPGEYVAALHTPQNDDLLKFNISYPTSRLATNSVNQSKLVQTGKILKMDHTEMMLKVKDKSSRYKYWRLYEKFILKRKEKTLMLLQEKNRIIVGCISRFCESKGKSSSTPDHIENQINNFKILNFPSKPSFEKLTKIVAFTTRDKMYDGLKIFAQSPIISVDIEFSYKKPQFPTVIQLSTINYGTLVILPEYLNDKCYKLLKSIFEDSRILKVMFGCSNDIVNSKILKIFPVGIVDVQHLFSAITGIDQKNSLQKISKLLLDMDMSKDETSTLFEVRDPSGHLEDESLKYSGLDSIAHLLCFYALLDKLIDGQRGEGLEERKIHILSILNQIYFQQTMRTCLKDPDLKLEDAASLDIEYNYEFMPKIMSMGNRAIRLASYLDQFRTRMFLKLCELSKHGALPNMTILYICEELPRNEEELMEILNTMEKEKGKNEPKNFVRDRVTEVVKKQAYFLLKIIEASKDPTIDFSHEIEHHATKKCMRCGVDSCITTAVCVNEKYVLEPGEIRFPDRKPKYRDDELQGTSRQNELFQQSKKYAQDDPRRKRRNEKASLKWKMSGKKRISDNKRIAAGRVTKSIFKARRRS